MGEAAGYGVALVDEAMEVFNEVRNSVELFPEARPALQELKAEYILIAVTNGNADLERIGDEIRDTWGLKSLRIQHRVGRLNVGETSVAIVSAASTAGLRPGT